MKQMMKRKTQIHNSGFLISPTTHLFPLSGQSRSRGVNIKNQDYFEISNMEYEIDNKSNYTTLHIRTTLVCKKKERKAKKETRTQIPPGGMVNRIERAYSKGPFLFISSDLKYQKINIYALCSLLSGIQRLTTSL